ncbi:MAG TPA: TonB-dependent receptor, partial [Saprospiraceae bacterium]|nr:TonB-dependent receptor [Saprospiraceae bacterium]
MKKSILLLFTMLVTSCFTLSAQMAMAQSERGKIAGKLTDATTNEDMIGATIQIEGTSTGAAADMEGKYSFSLEPGNYNLIISFLSYKTVKIPVEVKANEISYVNTSMEENTNVLEDIVITYTVEKSSALALLATRRNAAQVSDGVSADQIRKTPDRTTSDVLKRVTGASIQDGKFAVIRGMNDRYNAGYLDGALLPSTESDRKAFAFDVVPASLLDNLQVIKAGTPDLVGDFGGGIIKINTKAIPDELTQNITLGMQTHSLTTFKEFTQFKTYPGEEFNMLSSKRDIPSFDPKGLKSANTFPNSEEKNNFADITKNFNNDWSNTIKDAMPSSRFAYSLGLPIALTDTKKLGLIVALNYSNTLKHNEAEIRTFDGSGPVADFKDQTYNQNINSGGIINLNYVGAHTEINFRNLLNISTDNTTVVRNGIGSVNDDLKVKTLTNIINYNRLYNGILSLKQTVGKDLFNINASLNYSNVNRQIPDYRIVNYTKSPDFDDYQLALGDFFNTSSGRFASNLNENLYGANVDISKQFDSEKVKTEVKAGVFTQQRDRSFWGRSFVYNGSLSNLSYDPSIDLGQQNIAGNKLYLLEKTSDDISYYQGKSQLDAIYLMADQKYFSKLRAVYGVRYEKADIKVNNDKLVKSNIATINEGIYLPSLNLTWSLTDKSNIRAGYYASVNRPEFREL